MRVSNRLQFVICGLQRLVKTKSLTLPVCILNNFFCNYLVIGILWHIGMGEIHDGVNFMRAACVIAIEKAQISFEPLLEVTTNLGYRNNTC